MLSSIVIDDDPDTAGVFVDYLGLMGIDVLAVGYNGKDAAELYEAHRPDIVFLDLVMPDYDGFYALERIREYDPQAKVIVVTADITSDTEDRLNQLRPTDIIHKPFDPDLLKLLVTKHV